MLANKGLYVYSQFSEFIIWQSRIYAPLLMSLYAWYKAHMYGLFYNTR